MQIAFFVSIFKQGILILNKIKENDNFGEITQKQT